MDPFSQAALGAVVAQAAGHRTLGYRAAVYGALAGALPDVDVLFSLNGDFVDQLVSHRGITHSLFFAPVIGPALGWLIWYREKMRREDPGPRHIWMWAITLALLSHPLLDLLTPYGTQLMLPFSDARFAVNAMPIIDPVYTGLLALGLFAAWLPPLRRHVPASAVALLILTVSSTYLGYGWLQGVRTEAVARAQLEAKGVVPSQLAAFPTILQVHLRRVVARTSTEDRVGFYSTWAPCEIEWQTAPRMRDRDRLGPFLASREGRVFDWFTMGWARYDLQEAVNGLQLAVNDLRYGFDDDPLSSIFSISAKLDPTGLPIQTLAAGQVGPQDPAGTFDRLVQETYAPACRIFSRQTARPNDRTDS
ncbi:MAG: metal-dependent hydrolase [Gammaproteobacteria bacterium]|nr:MAG: metal-dependent hydrolase [Gammaproteobacteria bacterium]